MMQTNSSYYSAPLQRHLMNHPKSTHVHWQQTYQDYCYLYNVAYDAIVDFANGRETTVNPCYNSNSKKLSDEHIESISRKYLQSYNQDAKSQRTIRIKSFANHIANQPNIVKIRKYHGVKRPKTVLSDTTKCITSKEYKQKLTINKEKKQKALEAKKRLQKAKKEWKVTKNNTNSSYFTKQGKQYG